MRLSFQGFLKETVNAPKELPGYGKPVAGVDKHITYTKLTNKDDQITIDVPDNQWHHTIKGITKKVGKANDGSLEKFLEETVKPLDTGVANIWPGQVNMFAFKDDVDPTLSGQAHDDNNGQTTADFQSPLIKKKKLESFVSPKSEDAEQGGGYVFPQDEVDDGDKRAKNRPDTMDHAGGFANTSGFGGRTEEINEEFLRIEDMRKLGREYIEKKTKCPVCGSKDYALMPTDFETAKCKNPDHPPNESRLWDHGNIPGVNEEKMKEMVDYGIGLGATDSQYSGSSEKMKLKEKQKPMPFSAQNNYIGGAGGVGVAGNLPQDG